MTDNMQPHIEVLETFIREAGATMANVSGDSPHDVAVREGCQNASKALAAIKRHIKSPTLASFSLEDIAKRRATEALIEIHDREFQLIFHAMFGGMSTAIQWRIAQDKLEQPATAPAGVVDYTKPHKFDFDKVAETTSADYRICKCGLSEGNKDFHI